MKTKQQEVYDLEKKVGYSLVCCQCEVSISSESSTFELAMDAYKYGWACDSNGDPYCGDCVED